MLNQGIEQLLEESGAPCISVILPMQRLSRNRANNPEVLNNALSLAKNLFFISYSQPNKEIDGVIKKLDDLAESIDFTHLEDGIGLYVSPNISKLVIFPFPVIEKVKVGNTFEIRDLLYYQNTILDYSILSISKRHIHLYDAHEKKLTEVKNKEFPINYEETYEYARPTIGTSFSNSSLKGFERDKSVIEEIRLVDFLRIADDLLDKYIGKDSPLIISGGKKEIADYMQITNNAKRIIGKITGNYNIDKQLANLAWNYVHDYLTHQNQLLLENIRELFGVEMLAVGLEDVWKAATEGKGLELIVEKDFERSAYISKDSYNLKLKKPIDNTSYKFVGDAIESLIKITREKKGKISFVDNGEMNEFDGIVMKLRYNNNPIYNK